MAPRTRTDVAVVGGGLAGLAAAALAARGGARVTLFERSSALGGRALTQRQDGFAFNMGPHALYRAGEGMPILRELGLAPRGGKPSAAGGFAIAAGARHALPGGLFSLITTGLLSLPAKLEVAGLLGSLQRIDTRPLQDVPVAAGLERLARRAEVRALLAGLIRVATYANAPALQSAGAAIDQLKLALSSGVLYVDDGWQTLVDGLHRAATQAGVEVTRKARVATVEASATGVEVRLGDGSVVPASAAILAVSPQEARDLLPGVAASARWTEAAPIRAACLDVALRRLPDPRATFAVGLDRPLYLSVHSAVARLAPEDGALVHVARYLEPDAVDDPRRDEEELAALLDSMQPGWRDAVVHRRFLPRITVSNALVTAAGGGLRGRPGAIVPGVDRVYLAGDWVGPKGMLADASLASAQEAARLAASSTASVRHAVAAA